MARDIIKYVWYFFFFVLLQIMVLNNIQFSGYINPYLYPIFILLLPFTISKFTLLLVSFILGLTIDFFSNTPGMHTTACLTMAFARPYLLNLIAPRDGYEINQKPLASHFGWNWYFRYSFILFLIHHIILFFIESFTFQNFFHTLARIVFSFIFSLLLVLLSQMFFFNTRQSV